MKLFRPILKAFWVAHEHTTLIGAVWGQSRKHKIYVLKNIEENIFVSNMLNMQTKARRPTQKGNVRKLWE